MLLLLHCCSTTVVLHGHSISQTYRADTFGAHKRRMSCGCVPRDQRWATTSRTMTKRSRRTSFSVLRTFEPASTTFIVPHVHAIYPILDLLIYNTCRCSPQLHSSTFKHFLPFFYLRVLRETGPRWGGRRSTLALRIQKIASARKERCAHEAHGPARTATKKYDRGDVV